ncbi:MAG: bacillithiol biosynthesis deacetylase BshB1 [Planctomycetaceae bacterium]|nr:bacillithiol biosynthesis deacetylase BshB1 [Planctomycetaceae bacterium]
MTPPSSPLDVLVVAAHPDDAEISVGGTILRCRANGQSVGVLDLTTGEPTPQGTEAIRAIETHAASQVLNLDWRHNLGLPNRRLENDLEARRALAGALRLTRPGIVLAPYWDDAHPDHVAASALCDAARFWAKLSRTDLPGEPYHPPRIYYYWSVHLRIHPSAKFVVDITPFIEDKMAAVRCYASQVLTSRSAAPPTLLDDIRDRARYWGWTIGAAYAEPFASREEIGIRDLRALQ